MIVGIRKETFPGERRVAIVPTSIAALTKAGVSVRIEAGAGVAAGFSDRAYLEHGAAVETRLDVLAADVLLCVRCLGASAEEAHFRQGQVVIGVADPLSLPQPVSVAAGSGATAFALDLVPRTTRAQAMDVLSSQANLAGYKAVLLAAVDLPKILPMMTTAAGTIAPAKALIIGAGVAGLQAIATAKRLGAVVTGYDVRTEVKQQIESLGARFLELPVEAASGEGGYAKAMDEEFYRKQRELMAGALTDTDFVVSTAAVPGRKAPILITAEMVDQMRPGSVIVDVAAERGGNCELTKPGETVEHNGVRILGPLNLPSTMPTHASTLYAKNIVSFLLNLMKKGEMVIDLDDPIIKESLLFRDGAVTNERVTALLAEVAK